MRSEPPDPGEPARMERRLVDKSKMWDFGLSEVGRSV
jgi:hypothetical protein